MFEGVPRKYKDAAVGGYLLSAAFALGATNFDPSSVISSVHVMAAGMTVGSVFVGCQVNRLLIGPPPSE